MTVIDLTLIIRSSHDYIQTGLIVAKAQGIDGTIPELTTSYLWPSVPASRRPTAGNGYVARKRTKIPRVVGDMLYAVRPEGLTPGV
jgi:hypothetical protein